MANTITGFLETLVAASGDYNAAKVGNLKFLDSVYQDVRPEAVRNGQTIQIYFPDVGAFTDQQANDWSPEDINPSYLSVVFNQRPGKSILIRDFEQWQTSTGIMTKFIDPMYKRGQEYLNGQIATQLTAAIFNSNTPIVGGTTGEVKLADLGSAWGTLAAAKVPLDNPDDLFVLTHSDVHATMLQDSTWYQESLVGAMIAQQARTKADLGFAFNFRKVWDQQCPKKVSTTLTPTGTVSFTTSALTGVSTHFTTELEVGDKFTTVANSDTTVYTVVTITDDTHLVIRGADATPTTFTSTSTKAIALSTGYSCIAMHRYAIALAMRPLDLVNDGHVQSRLIMLHGIPFRVTVSYVHQKAGYLLSMDVGCAVKTIRPDFGVLIKV